MITKDYFHGWYFKMQSKQKTLAVIAACHISNGVPTCSIQLITDDNAHNVTYPISAFRSLKGGKYLKIGNSSFCMRGIKLDIDTDGLIVKGTLRFSDLTPIGYDIMGPFALVPFLECRHTIVSMRHRVDGYVEINGEPFSFKNSVGYIEGDRGRSFPSVYAWTQCCFKGGSLSLSVADIPVGPFHFTGIIGVVMLGKKQYRIATYLGAKAVSIQDDSVTVRQGDLTLTATLIAKKAFPLKAPVSGSMARTIFESASCTAGYRFMKNDDVLLDIVSERAAFEYEYP